MYPIHSGDLNDSAGPGEYEFTSIFSRKKGIAFDKTPPRNRKDADQVVGPGRPTHRQEASFPR